MCERSSEDHWLVTTGMGNPKRGAHRALYVVFHIAIENDPLTSMMSLYVIINQYYAVVSLFHINGGRDCLVPGPISLLFVGEVYIRRQSV
jgi:hypothetical protein